MRGCVSALSSAESLWGIEGGFRRVFGTCVVWFIGKVTVPHYS